MAIPNQQEDGKLLKGQLVDKEFRVTIPYTQQVRNFDYGGESPDLANENAEVTVLDANASESKIFDYSGIDASKLATFWQNPSFVSFQLPEELISLTAIWSTSKGVGAGLSVPNAESHGTSWSIGVSATNRATSGLDFVPDLQPEIKTYFTANVPCIECYFFTTESSMMADVLALLTAKLGVTVLIWPAFKPKRISLTLKGQSLELSTTANLQLSASVTAGNTSVADNSGYDYSIQPKTIIKPIDLGPFLFADLTIGGTPGGTASNAWQATDTLTVTASATVTGAGDLTGSATGGTTVPTQTVSGLISPHTFSHTSPAAVPTSGLYLQNITPQANDGSLFLQRAIVVDFAYFA